MQLRCPYCHAVFAQLENPACPQCGRTLRMAWERDMKAPADRAAWRATHGRRPETHPTSRRKLPTRPSAMLLPTLLFTYRSRFFMWTLILAATIAARLLFTKVTESQLQPGATGGWEARARTEMVALRTALEWFRAHCKRYPTDAEGLRSLVRDPGAPGWGGHYIDQLTSDPWGHPYQYGCTNDTITLGSWGKDGIASTVDDIPAPETDWKALLRRVDVRELPRWVESNAAPRAAAGVSPTNRP